MRYDGQDAGTLTIRLQVPHVVLLDTTTSTLDLVHELGAQGAPSGSLVLAEEQTAGRGRLGRRWDSARGAGIWLGMLLRPRVVPAGGALALRAGLETVAAVAEAEPALKPRLKWPNDVIVNARKAGGILCEARWSGDVLGWVAVGIGINVKGPMPNGTADVAVALDEVARVERLAVLDRLVPRIARIADAEAELTYDERSRFLRLAWHPRADEIVADLAPDGALLVRRADGSLDRRTDPA